MPLGLTLGPALGPTGLPPRPATPFTITAEASGDGFVGFSADPEGAYGSKEGPEPVPGKPMVAFAKLPFAGNVVVFEGNATGDLTNKAIRAEGAGSVIPAEADTFAYDAGEGITQIITASTKVAFEDGETYPVKLKNVANLVGTIGPVAGAIADLTVEQVVEPVMLAGQVGPVVGLSSPALKITRFLAGSIDGVVGVTADLTVEEPVSGLTYVGHLYHSGSVAGFTQPTDIAGVQNGDLLIAMQISARQNPGTPGSGAGSWTAMGGSFIGTAGTTTAVQVTAYRKLKETGDSLIVGDGGDHQMAVVFAFRGAGTPYIASSSAASVSATSLPLPAVTTTSDNNLLMPYVGWSVDRDLPSISWTADAALEGLVEIFDQGTLQGNGGGVSVALATMPVAGTTNNPSFTATYAGAAALAGVVIAIPPAE